LPIASGCATHADQLVKVRTFFQAGDLAAASMLLDDGKKKDGPDADVLKLETAVVRLAEGKPKDAEVLLREVRDHFDEIDKPTVGETALSMFSDDNHRPYGGEDYEKVLIRAFLAMSNMMGDGGDAIAYSHQVTDKQQEIIAAAAKKPVDSSANQQGEPESVADNPKLAYKQVAIGPYLSGVIREQTHVNYDDAARAYQQVVYFEPQFQAGRFDLDRARNGHHSQRGNGVVYVFALVGRGPYKVESTEVPTTAALMVADFILKSNNKYSLPISQAPVKIPKVVCPTNEVDNVQVSVGGQLAGRTETITDIGRMAVEQQEAVMPQVIARAIVRRIVKRGVVEGTKLAVGVDDRSAFNLLFDAAELAWGAAEAPDTRCWGLLPAKIQVCRIELPAGEHQIALTPALGDRNIGGPQTTTVRVVDGGNTYLMANFPDHRMTGKIVSSQP
jgi:hypothetical protein